MGYKDPAKQAEANRKWYSANKDRAKELNKRWNADNRERVRARRKGLDPRDVPPMTDACECCGKVGPVVLDHCHSKVRFRGWLCHHCNTALGYVKDDTRTLQQLIDYLRRVA